MPPKISGNSKQYERRLTILIFTSGLLSNLYIVIAQPFIFSSQVNMRVLIKQCKEILTIHFFILLNLFSRSFCFIH